MSESMAVFIFFFLKTVEIKLPDEAYEFGVSEKFGKNLCLNSFFVKDIDHPASLIPSHNFRV